MRPSSLVVSRAAAVCGATAVAGAITAVNRTGWIGLSSLAASPKAVAEGKIWLLLTSGVIADRPWLPSLLGFAIAAFAALSIAPVRVVVAAAFAGHVLATLAVYGFLGVVRAIDRDAFGALVGQADVGLSAIIAAWIGVVAQAMWSRYRSRRGHVLTAAGCVGCALIGFAFRSDVTVLDSEHIVAFALGVAISAWWPPPSRKLAPANATDVDRELETLLENARPLADRRRRDRTADYLGAIRKRRAIWPTRD
jgi:hypothetical protein